MSDTHPARWQACQPHDASWICSSAREMFGCAAMVSIHMLLLPESSGNGLRHKATGYPPGRKERQEENASFGSIKRTGEHPLSKIHNGDAHSL